MRRIASSATLLAAALFLASPVASAEPAQPPAGSIEQGDGYAFFDWENWQNRAAWKHWMEPSGTLNPEKMAFTRSVTDVADLFTPIED
ncbi:hypothetical protein SAMN05421810_102449 [Amycolatopsis arida]|uniref:Uncharacterized protein n=1 Tax=Amycolatopsis arida TaxID=587909 RepID=A0A1I5PYS4_9PSEU|nr:hypothetical protein [Amycolatopsis arida]TDX98655.1 hypothetical protein CLV69_101449 [Amycolatopsis arida]SFP39152.1 hypothetical protein SAMN05421810_102449 [Amycolatopsis arida]